MYIFDFHSNGNKKYFGWVGLDLTNSILARWGCQDSYFELIHTHTHTPDTLYNISSDQIVLFNQATWFNTFFYYLKNCPSSNSHKSLRNYN